MRSPSKINMNFPTLYTVNFYLIECDINMHKSDFYTPNTIFTCTVWFIHAECNFNTQVCEFNTQKIRFCTHSKIFTRRVWFYMQNVLSMCVNLTLWFLHARVAFLHTECNFYMQGDFDKHKCDSNTHSCDCNTQGVISHAECGFYSL
jgi:hypothetical protein